MILKRSFVTYSFGTCIVILGPSLAWNSQRKMLFTSPDSLSRQPFSALAESCFEVLVTREESVSIPESPFNTLLFVAWSLAAI